MTQNEVEMIISRLDRIEEKLDNHIEESASVHSRLAVAESELRFFKFVAAGFGTALILLTAETLWKLL